MSKLRNKLRQLSKALTIIEMYNSHYIMGAEEDLRYLKERIKDVQFLPTDKLETELEYIINMVKSYYELIPPDFIKQYAKYLEDLEKEMV